MIPGDRLSQIKQLAWDWTVQKLGNKKTVTKRGSLNYLFFGEKVSDQSINIKMGYFGQMLTKETIKIRGNPFRLMEQECGLQAIQDKKKDIDLLFHNQESNTIFYRELKGNIELDTEKLPATIEKCRQVRDFLCKKYPQTTVDIGILNWSVYNRNNLHSGLPNIKTFEKAGIKIDHMGDFFQIIDFIWEEEDYYEFCRELGKTIQTL